ncbi:MAG: DUF5683 domain-containing protein [Acidobacteriota bacterium]
MKNKPFIIFIFILYFLYTGYLFPSKGPDNPATGKKALEKSLIFPGLGQLIEKKYFNGILFITGELFCITNFLINNSRGNEAYENYKIADTTENAIIWREKVEKYDKKRNIFLLAGAGIWILNLVDIFIHIKKKYKRNISLSIKNGKNNKISLGIGYSF